MLWSYDVSRPVVVPQCSCGLNDHALSCRSEVSCCNPEEYGDSYRSDPFLHSVGQPLLTLGTCQVSFASRNATGLIVTDDGLARALAPSLLSW